MIVERVSAYKYRLPLSRTLHLRNQSLIERRGLLVSLTAQTGEIGWGEIAPLPGYSVESLEAAEAQTRKIAQTLIGLQFPIPAIQLPVLFTGQQLVPSVQCGLEAAVLHLSAELTGAAIDFGGHIAHEGEIPLNGLLIGEEDALLHQASLMISQGYRSLKLKVGHRSLDQEIALSYRLHARLGPGMTLRLDANRAWTFDQALAFDRAVEILRLEYVEEPLRDPSRLAELAAHWSTPVALDESLAERTPGRLIKYPGLAAIVIKPMLLGGFSAARAWTDWAANNGVTAVVSSSFESNVGLAMLGQFATQTDPKMPCGLDTADWFRDNLLERPLEIIGGAMRVPSNRTLPSEIRTNKLEFLWHV